MKLAFYKAEYGNWQDKAIAIWTGSKYSHVELVIDTNVGFSASNRMNKVRIAQIDFTSKHWEVVDFEPMLEMKEMHSRMQETLDARYDWIGIFLHQFLPFNTQSKSKWWCSEVVAYVLGYKDYRINPQELYEKVTK